MATGRAAAEVSGGLEVDGDLESELTQVTAATPYVGEAGAYLGAGGLEVRAVSLHGR